MRGDHGKDERLADVVISRSAGLASEARGHGRCPLRSGVQIQAGVRGLLPRMVPAVRSSEVCKALDRGKAGFLFGCGTFGGIFLGGCTQSRKADFRRYVALCEKRADASIGRASRIAANVVETDHAAERQVRRCLK